MQLSPEQLEQVRQAKEAKQARAIVNFTPEQKSDWQRSVEQENSGKEANISQLAKIRTAAEQPGLFGDLRRAIQADRRRLSTLALEIGVEPHTLSAFCAGEGDLTPATIDRLTASLGLRLMQEIGR